MQRLTKDQLLDRIETILGDAIIKGEEIDLTANRIASHFWPIIQYYQDQEKLTRKTSTNGKEKVTITKGL